MKRSLFTLLMVFFTASMVWSQSLATLSFQGVLRQPSGQAVPDGNYAITFRLYAQESGGSEIWSEAQSSVNVRNGVCSVVLGSINPMNVAFDQPYWIGISINNESELQPRTRLTSSPYAMSLVGVSNKFPSAGNVGVGTTSPAYMLDVNGDLNFTGSLRQNGSVLPANPWLPNGSSIYYGGGGVGIGTSTPGSLLHVYDAAGGTWQGRIVASGPDNAVTMGQLSGQAVIGAHNAALSGWANLSINPGGAVAMGSYTVPDATTRLYVADGQIRVTNAESGSGTLRVGAAWNSPGIYAEGGNPLILASEIGTVQFKNLGGADVMIQNIGGGPSISPQWDGWGSLGHTDYRWGSVMTYNVYYSNLVSLSDERVKENIRPLEGALSKIMRLNGYSYDYNPDAIPGNKKPNDDNPLQADFNFQDRQGFLAQEIEEVMPNLVTTYDKETGIKAVNYEGILPVVVEAMKEQQALIEQLQNEVTALKLQQQR